MWMCCVEWYSLSLSVTDIRSALLQGLLAAYDVMCIGAFSGSHWLPAAGSTFSPGTCPPQSHRLTRLQPEPLSGRTAKPMATTIVSSRCSGNSEPAPRGLIGRQGTCPNSLAVSQPCLGGNEKERERGKRNTACRSSARRLPLAEAHLAGVRGEGEAYSEPLFASTLGDRNR